MTSIKIACALLILTFSTTATTQEKIKVKSKPILKKCKKKPNPDDCTSNKLLLSINEKIKYPEISKKNIQGRIVLEYTVFKNANLSAADSRGSKHYKIDPNQN